MSDSQIFLKKGVPVARVVSTMLVSRTELSPEMEATLGEESRPESLLVAKTAGEVELGRVGPLVPRECGGSERASPGLSCCVCAGEQ